MGDGWSSHEQWKKTTWLLRVYWGLYYPVVLGLSYTSRRMKDPYQTTSIMESKFAFFNGSHIITPIAGLEKHPQNHTKTPYERRDD